MFTLINELWKVQQVSQYQISLNIPQTIMLVPNKPLEIIWYFTGNQNKILKRTKDKVSIESIINYFKKYNQTLIGTHKIVATVTQTYGFESSQPQKLQSIDDSLLRSQDLKQSNSENQLKTRFMNLSDLTQFLLHSLEYPHLIDQPVIIQQYQHDQQTSLNCKSCQSYIKVIWNPNYDFIQQCYENSEGDELFITHLEQPKELKLSQHFRELIKKLTTEIIQKIELSFISKRGKLTSSQLLFKVHEDKPSFIWCVEACFENEIITRTSNENVLWRKAKNFSLMFKNNLQKQEPKKSKLNLISINQGSITDRNHKDQILPVNKERVRGHFSFRAENQTQILDSFRSSSTNTNRIKLTNLSSIVKSKPFQEKINKNRSRSFCRITTNLDSIDSKLNDSYQNSQKSVETRRLPLSSRGRYQIMGQVDHIIRDEDQVSERPSFRILKSITDQLQKIQESAILKETNQLFDNKIQLRQRLSLMKIKTDRSYIDCESHR